MSVSDPILAVGSEMFKSRCLDRQELQSEFSTKIETRIFLLNELVDLVQIPSKLTHQVVDQNPIYHYENTLCFGYSLFNEMLYFGELLVLYLVLVDIGWFIEYGMVYRVWYGLQSMVWFIEYEYLVVFGEEQLTIFDIEGSG